jgi:hypothetical protein
MACFGYKIGIAALAVLLSVSAASGQGNAVAPVLGTQIRSAAGNDSDSFFHGTADFGPYDDAMDEDVEQAAWLQQPGTPSLATSQPTVRRAATASRLASTSLASVPNMFGDCGMTTANVTIINANGRITAGEFMLPMVGGARTAKIAENDIAMPVDRIFFGYNHYTDIFQMREQVAFPPGAPGLFRQEPIDRYTMGVEKTFFDAWTSVELRMPFNGSFNATLPSLGVANGNVGNLAVILKGLLYRGPNMGIGAGLGIDTPTGSDTVARLGTVNLRFQNQATHLLPYLGFLYAPGDPQWGWGNGLFMTGFLQVDVAANGNTIQFVDPATAGRTSLGKYNEQNLLFADLSVGYWLYRDSYAPRWTGLAVVGEVHYTTSLQDPDVVAGAAGGTGAVITNTSNRFDIVNGTIGVQALMFDASSLRVAGVFPMGSRQDQRMFDAELQVQFNRRF